MISMVVVVEKYAQGCNTHCCELFTRLFNVPALQAANLIIALFGQGMVCHVPVQIQCIVVSFDRHRR